MRARDRVRRFGIDLFTGAEAAHDVEDGLES